MPRQPKVAFRPNEEFFLERNQDDDGYVQELGEQFRQRRSADGARNEDHEGRILRRAGLIGDVQYRW